MKLVAHLLVNEFGLDEEWFESEHAMRAELKCAAKARARRMGQAGEQEFRKFCERIDSYREGMEFEVERVTYARFAELFEGK